MLRLLRILIIGHDHRWKTIKTAPLTTFDHRGKEEDRGERYHQQCEVCGKVVKRDLI